MRDKNENKPAGFAPNGQMLRRTIVLMAVFGIALFVLLLLRLYKLQIVDHDYYESLAIEQQLREAPTAAARGSIYDRNMLPLGDKRLVLTVHFDLGGA